MKHVKTQHKYTHTLISHNIKTRKKIVSETEKVSEIDYRYSTM